MKAVAKIQGLKEVQAALKALPVAMQRQAEAAVLRGGGKVIADKAKANCTAVDQGDLKKSIAFNVKRFRGSYSARVGPRAGIKKQVGTYSRGKKAGQARYKNPVKYSHLIEFGTAHSAAKPFLRPAMESSRNEVVSAMLSSYRKHLDKIAKRVAKRRAKR